VVRGQNIIFFLFSFVLKRSSFFVLRFHKQSEWTWNLDLGIWKLKSEFWNLGLGTWILELGNWNLNFGIWVLELGNWNLNFGIWVLEIGSWILETGNLSFGIWVLELGSWNTELPIRGPQAQFYRTSPQIFSEWSCRNVRSVLLSVAILRTNQNGCQ